MSESALKEVIIRPAVKTSIFSTFADVWRNRNLVYYFFIRSLQQRYKGTLLGWWWMILKPLVPTLLSTMIFGKLAKIPSDGMPYLLFAFTGFAIWNLFSYALVFITRSIRGNRKLFTKLYFPRIIVPVASIAPALAEFLVTLCMFFVIALFYLIKDGKMYINVSPSFFAAIYFVFMTIMLILGVGLWTAVLNAHSRDMRFTLPYILQGWMFITPVVYPISFIPEKWHWLVYLNPMTVLVEGYKWSVIGRGRIDILFCLLNAIIILSIFISAVWFFKKVETAFIDNL